METDMRRKNVKKRIKMRIVVLVIVLGFIGSFFWLTNFHVHEGFPGESDRAYTLVDAVYLNNHVYFYNNEWTRTLCKASLDGMKFTHNLGISKVLRLVGEGDTLYILTTEEILYVYDVVREETISKIDLKTEIRPKGMDFFNLVHADSEGVWLDSEDGNDAVFINISPNGKKKVFILKDMRNAHLINLYQNKLIYTNIDDDEKLQGIYLFNPLTEERTKISKNRMNYSSYYAPNFIWQDELIVSSNDISTGICRIKLDGSGEKNEQFGHDHISCKQGDIIYAFQAGVLRAYNLKSRETFEASSDRDENYDGVISIADDKVFISGSMIVFPSYGKTKIYFEKLDNLKWEKIRF